MLVCKSWCSLLRRSCFVVEISAELCEETQRCQILIDLFPRLTSLTLPGYCACVEILLLSNLTCLNFEKPISTVDDSTMDADNMFFKFSNISMLTNLISLSIPSHPYIWNISSLTSLKKLNLQSNSLIHNDTLSKLVGLTHLDLTNNTLISGSALKYLTNLTSLVLVRNVFVQFDDVRPMKISKLYRHFLDLPYFQEGKGILVDASKNIIYSGEFLNGLKHGQGIYVRHFEGNLVCEYDCGWRKGVKHGKGVKVYSNGDFERGEWFDGKRIGLFIVKTDELYLEEEWNTVHRPTRGKIYYQNGDLYDGDWINEYSVQRNELGELVVLDAKTEVGKYPHDWFLFRQYNRQRHGKGTLTKVNGEKYVGDWYKGKMHGKGTWFYPNGNFYHTEWLDGILLNKPMA